MIGAYVARLVVDCPIALFVRAFIMSYVAAECCRPRAKPTHQTITTVHHIRGISGCVRTMQTASGKDGNAQVPNSGRLRGLGDLMDEREQRMLQ